MKKILVALSISVVILSMIVTISVTGCKATTEDTIAASAETVAETTAAAIESGVKPLKIGYCVSYGTTVPVKAIIKGAVDEVKSQEWSDKFDPVEVIIVDAGMPCNVAKYVNGLEDLFAQGVDGLLIFPAEASEEASGPVKELYNKNNVPVAITDIGITSGEYVIFTVTDNYAGGALAAEYAAKFMEKGSKVQAFNGSPGSINATNRCTGYEDKMRELGMEVLPTRGTTTLFDRAQKDMEDLLVSDPDIKGIFTTTQPMGMGVLRAVENANLIGKIMITPFDIEADGYKAIQEGKLTACVVQDFTFIGQKGGEGLMKSLLGEIIEQKDVVVTPLLCTIENYKDFADNTQILPAE